MCYAIPGKVEAVEGNRIIVDYFGEKKKAINELPDIKAGDYIYAQGGYVITRISEQEALGTLDIWKDLFFELQDTDVKLSHLDLSGKNIDPKILGILDRASQSLPLNDQELLSLMNLKNPEELELLYKTANYIRQRYLSNSCCVHGIIEFSNFCESNCLYCGISSSVRGVHRYRMTKNEIVESAWEAVNKYGFKALVLQSGEDSHFSAEALADIVREIKEKMPVLIFISAGEIGIPGLKKLFDAGARGLLMRFESSNPKIYENIHPGQKLESRLEHLKAAYEMGYLIVTGGLIGLPGQSYQDLLDDIQLAKNLHAEMYSFGPFIPNPGTRLAGETPVKTDDVLKVLALSRIIDPENAKILVTTGFETFDAEARQKGLMAGANSVMLNVTPEIYKKDYQIYPNRAHINDSLSSQIDVTLNLLKNIGRAPTDLGVN